MLQLPEPLSAIPGCRRGVSATLIPAEGLQTSLPTPNPQLFPLVLCSKQLRTLRFYPAACDNGRKCRGWLGFWAAVGLSRWDETGGF